jgi:uncharacterized membrane protein YdfJ with MMPL/SSD domain
MSLRGLARLCYRRRRVVVAAWLVVLVGIVALSSVIGTNFTTNFSAPNTESTRASNLLRADFKAQSGDVVQVALKGTPSIRRTDVRAQVEAFTAAFAGVRHVTNVSDPYVTPGGISRSGAAAAIMCTFFLSFVLGDNIIIKLFGIGFASAIFIDATLIRLLIVPSTMELLGDANWWLPDWLDRILPHVDVEGPAAVPDAGRRSTDEDEGERDLAPVGGAPE